MSHATTQRGKLEKFNYSIPKTKKQTFEIHKVDIETKASFSRPVSTIERGGRRVKETGSGPQSMIMTDTNMAAGGLARHKARSTVGAVGRVSQQVCVIGATLTPQDQ
ncbi:hypothetical protein Bpfe_012991 [Biomphalaria pfeifferi]|uniref:Uncharacterized protein n=1 Tax=Biomphalaria pfeifferi TaxID=112525 RepID=A0AAD8BNT0_BIOPF|nr:hypothetical protein Bpfe_012991 [Biomphalaria pfeifferi]